MASLFAQRPQETATEEPRPLPPRPSTNVEDRRRPFHPMPSTPRANTIAAMQDGGLRRGTGGTMSRIEDAHGVMQAIGGRGQEAEIPIGERSDSQAFRAEMSRRLEREQPKRSKKSLDDFIDELLARDLKKQNERNRK